MLDAFHLGDKIRNFNYFRRGAVSGEDDVFHRRFFFEFGNDLGRIQKIVFHYIIDLIEDNEFMLGVVENFLALFPREKGGLHVLLKIFGIPGETLAHRKNFEPVSKSFRGLDLARFPFSLDELDHRDFVAAADRAKRRAEGRRALAFSVARVDEDQAFFFVALLNFVAARGFVG